MSTQGDLQVKKFYCVLERFVGSEGIFTHIDALHDAAQKFANETSNIRVVSIDTTAVQSSLCCAVWYYEEVPVVRKVVKVIKRVESSNDNNVEPETTTVTTKVASSSSSSSSLSSNEAAVSSKKSSNDSFPDPEGGTEMQTRAIVKPKKPLPAKYVNSALRVAFKPVDYSQGDMVSVKLRCTLKGEMKEFVFSAKKPTLEGLGFANMEEGVVEMKDLALLSMHFLIDDMNKSLADIDVDLTPEKLNAAFPTYRTAVARPHSPAANSSGSCVIV